MRNFPKLSTNSIRILEDRLRKKASQSLSKFRVAAIAFDSKGEFLGQAFNSVPFGGIEAKPGAGVHAEAKLMRKYGTLVKTIVISRVGNAGDWRPIKPCHNCQSLADKMGVKIITIDGCREQSH